MPRTPPGVAAHYGVPIVVQNDWNNSEPDDPDATKYLNLPKETEEALIQMNIKTMHELTRIVLPLMVQKYATQPCVAARVASSRAARHRVSHFLLSPINSRKGAIINLSSVTGCIPTPLLSVYSAAKAYVNYFSVALAHEYARAFLSEDEDEQCLNTLVSCAAAAAGASPLPPWCGPSSRWSAAAARPPSAARRR